MNSTATSPVEAADARDAARYRTLRKNAAMSLHAWVKAYYDAQTAGSLDELLDRRMVEETTDEEVER